MDEWTPDTQPDGALTPPPRVPPIAIATSAPLPPPPPPRRRLSRRSEVGSLLRRTLDQLDRIADGIAEAVGLR